MNRRPFFKLGLGLVAAGALLVAGVGKAGGFFDRRELFKKRLTAHIEDMLDTVEASEAQRQSVAAVRDRLFAAFDAHKQERNGLRKKSLELFAQETLDPAELEALRAEHVAALDRSSRDITQAISDLHDTFTPEQRKKLTEELRALGEHGRWGCGGAHP